MSNYTLFLMEMSKLALIERCDSLAAKNMRDLEKIMQGKLKLIVADVIKETEKVMKDAVKEVIYDVKNTSESENKYKRTGDFLNAFKADKVRTISKGKVSANLMYDWESMTPPKPYTSGGDMDLTHGYSGPGGYTDRRKELWWILENDGMNVAYSDTSVGGAYGPRARGSYLDPFYDDMKERFPKFISDSIKKNGMKEVK